MGPWWRRRVWIQRDKIRERERKKRREKEREGKDSPAGWRRLGRLIGKARFERERERGQRD